MKKQIIISIDDKGQIVSEVKGVEGKECVSFASPLYKLIGEEKEEDRKYKPEYQTVNLTLENEEQKEKLNEQE